MKHLPPLMNVSETSSCQSYVEDLEGMTGLGWTHACGGFRAQPVQDVTPTCY